MEFVWKVISALGGAAVILAALVAASYWLFQTFSERWLQSKFDARLESLRHAQNQDLEQLRFRISALMDRTTKLHEREYQVLPGLWEELASAWAETAAYVSPFQQIPDLSMMSDVQLEEHLSRTELYESQKETVRASSNRTKAFQEEIYWHRKAKVSEHVRNFSRAMRFNGIFVPKDIKDKMGVVSELMWDALLEHEMNEEHDIRPKERKVQKRVREEGKALLDEIENAIQDRLWKITTTSEPLSPSSA